MSPNATTMVTTAIHAPAANLPVSTTSSTTDVETHPTPLINRDRAMRPRADGSVSVLSSRVQWRTMPACPRLNATNTPTMYSWMSRVTSASKTHTKTTAIPARNRMPLLKASRSPRVWNWRGR